ncbi:MAG: TetR/AcrR family transcriptional regulator [Acidimicrobiales bacterium]
MEQVTETDRSGATDGRVARRNRNRMAVLDAAIAMFAEGNLQPMPSEVAKRCGISHRSINRYFPDNRSLLRAAVDRQIEVGIPLYRIHSIGQGDLAHRVDEFVRVRLDGYEVLGATARAATLLASTVRLVRTELAAVRDLLSDQVERQFAPELEALPDDQRAANTMAIDALFQFETLDFYRRHRGLGMDETHDLLSRTLADLLAAGRTAPVH